MSKNKIFWGVTFIVAALVIIADIVLLGAGVISMEQLPIWKIVVGFMCIAFAVWGIVHRHYWMPIPMLGALFLTFQDNLAALFGAPALKDIPLWAVLTGTALLTVGAVLILHSGIVKRQGTVTIKTSKGTAGDDSRTYKNGANVVYIDCADLTEHEINNRTGAMDVYFSNIDQYPGNGTLIINNRLGAVEVHVPQNWSVDVSFENHMGAVDNKVPQGATGPTLHVRGENHMGAVEIKSDTAGAN